MTERTASNLNGVRICLLTKRDLEVDARLAREAQALAVDGADVHVVAISPQREHGREAVAAGGPGYQVHRIVRRPAYPVTGAGPSLLGALWRYLRNAGALIRSGLCAWRLDADVYHSSDLQPLPVTWCVAKLRRKPLVYEAREISSDREAYQRFRAAVMFVEGRLSRGAAGFITTTDMRADHFRSAYGVESVVVVQNRPIYQAASASDLLRQRLSLADDDVICLYQGGLQQGRGLEELIDAVREVPGMHLVLLGRGNLEAQLRAQIRAADLTDRVHLLPAVPWQELPAWTSSADVGVQLLQNTCLNHYSTDSNKLFEYGLAGLAVLASDFPEIRRVLDEWQFGLLVDPADREAVVGALTRITADPALRETLAGNAIKAGRALSWETQVPALLKLYRQLAPAYTSVSSV